MDLNRLLADAATESRHTCSRRSSTIAFVNRSSRQWKVGSIANTTYRRLADRHRFHDVSGQQIVNDLAVHVG
jgi:hypothetical protein